MPSSPTYRLSRATRFGAGLCVALILLVAASLFVPPLRDQVFAMSLWPWPLPGEVTTAQLQAVQKLAQPGDVIVESNMHYGQWVALSYVFTGSPWVHAALVDNQKHLITMEGKVAVLPMSIYDKWHSTRLALILSSRTRNRSKCKKQFHMRSCRRTPQYDPWFENPDASCTGVVGEALSHAGMAVPYEVILGRRIYGADSFFKIPGAQVIWTTDRLSVEHSSV